MSLRFAFMLLYTPLAMVVGLVKPLWGVFALMAMYYFRPEIWEAPEWFQPVLFISLACIAGWAVNARDIRIEPTIILSTVILITMLVSSSLAWKDTEASFGATNVVLKLVVIQFLIVQLIRNTTTLKYFLWVNIIGNLWTMKTVLIKTAAQSDVSRVDVHTGQGGGANYLAMLFVMGLPLFYFKYFYGTEREKKLSLLLAPLYLVCVAGTQSRGGFLALLLIFFFCMAKSGKKLQGAGVALALVLLMFIVTPQAGIDRFMTTFESGDQRGFAASSRLSLWRASTEMWKDSPIVGVGHDNFQLLSPKYAGFFAGATPVPYDASLENDPRYKGFVAHSTYFQLLADGGLLGLLPFLFLCGFCFTSLWGVRRLKLRPEDRGEIRLYSTILEGIFIAMCFAALFGSHLKIDFFWWYVGAIAALRLIARGKAASYRRELQEELLQRRAEQWGHRSVESGVS